MKQTDAKPTRGSQSDSRSVYSQWWWAVVLGATLIPVAIYWPQIRVASGELPVVGGFLYNPSYELLRPIDTELRRRGLQVVAERNYPVDGFNTIPAYFRAYAITLDQDHAKQIVREILTSQGYKVKEQVYTYDPNCNTATSGDACPETAIVGSTKNSKAPYWVLSGLAPNGFHAHIEISERTFFNESDGAKGPGSGERPVPAHSSIVTIAVAPNGFHAHLEKF
jgi:hypothetical protein